MTQNDGFRPTAWQSFKDQKGRRLLVLAGFCLVILVFGLVNLSKGARLAEAGQRVMAEVVGTEVTQQIRHNAQGNLSTTYQVDLRFETAAGVVIETTQTLPGRIFREVAGAMVAEVTYLPEDPEVLEFEPGQRLQSGRVAAIGGGIGLLVAAAALLQIVMRLRREG